jgi:putative ATPase
MNTSLAEHVFPSGQVLRIVQGDITTETVDAIVNAANQYLAHGGGVAGVISRKGGPSIQQESDAWVSRHGPVLTGGAAITGAGLLPCKAVIHAVGPVWHGGGDNEDEKLRSAVSSSLMLAHDRGFQTISLPAISSGIFGFPKDRCARILLETVGSFCRQHPTSPLQEVRVVLYDQPTLDAFLEALKRQLNASLPRA